jgi:hypothetical protein
MKAASAAFLLVRNDMNNESQPTKSYIGQLAAETAP